MTNRPAATDLEARFESELARDRRLLAFLEHATLAVSLLTVAVLLTLAIPMGRTSVWLATLPFYSAGTRLCVFIARHALRMPLFLLQLDSRDTTTRSAARTVFEKHRDELATALLTRGNERPTLQQVRDLTPEQAAAIALELELPERRRTGAICALVWAAISMLVWGTLFVTGGGPAGFAVRN